MIKQNVDVTIKQNFDVQTFKDIVEQITHAQNLQELYLIGKKLTDFELNGYKRAALLVYKNRKKEIVQNMLQENTVFSNLFYIIITSNIKQLKNVGKLLYNIKNTGILSKEEINELFEAFEQRKMKLINEENDANEIFNQDNFNQDNLDQEEIELSNEEI